jgi:hypothetical protein
MKRNSCLLIAFLFCCTLYNANAQKLKEKSVTIATLLAGKTVFPSYVKTYAVVAKGWDEGNNKFIMKKFVLSGYTKIENDKAADVTIIFDSKEMTCDDKKIEEIEEKGQSGQASKSYRYSYTYTWPMRFTIVSYPHKAKLFEATIYSEKEKIKVHGSSFDNLNTLKTLQGSASGNTYCVQAGLVKVNDTINVFQQKREPWWPMSVYTAKGSKELKYDDLDEAYKKCKDGLKKTVKADTIPATIQSLQSAIDIWQKALAEADTNNVNARINKEIYYGIHFNLALAYFGLKDFEQAWKHIREVSKSPDKHFRADVSDFTKMACEFQSNYYLNNYKVPVSDIFVGKWKLVKFISEDSYDLNGDGKRSTDILSERNECERNEVYEFKSDNSLIVHKGENIKNCTKPNDNLYWKATSNKTNEKKYLFWDTTPIKKLSDADVYLEILHFDSRKFTIQGDLHVSGDTTTGCTLTFERIDE